MNNIRNGESNETVKKSCGVFLVLLLPVCVQASVPKQDVIFKQEEILDKDLLFNRAKLGISDINENLTFLRADLKNTTTGASIPIDAFSTTQLLRIEDVKGVRKEVYGDGYTEFRMEEYPTTMTYQYDIPSSWKPVSGGAQYCVGQRSYTLIKRGGSSWDLYLEVYERDP